MPIPQTHSQTKLTCLNTWCGWVKIEREILTGGGGLAGRYLPEIIVALVGIIAFPDDRILRFREGC